MGKKIAAVQAYMTLTSGLDCDRNGNYYEQIIPDIAIAKEDNFDDLFWIKIFRRRRNSSKIMSRFGVRIRRF